jgi:hypothetical protein
MGAMKQMLLEQMDRDAKREDRESEAAARDDDVGFKEARETKKGEKSK